MIHIVEYIPAEALLCPLFCLFGCGVYIIILLIWDTLSEWRSVYKGRKERNRKTGGYDY